MSRGFGYAMAFVLPQEGGFIADLGDGAGPTNFGITQRSYPDRNIQALTEAEARAIYERDYYSALQLDLLPAPLAVAVFDGAVQHGPQTSIRLLQQVLGLVPDGILGPLTAEAAAKSPDVLRLYCTHRLLRYTQSANWAKFGKGWSQRLLACYGYCLGLPH